MVKISVGNNDCFVFLFFQNMAMHTTIVFMTNIENVAVIQGVAIGN